jgi:hypothetical protein
MINGSFHREQNRVKISVFGGLSILSTVNFLGALYLNPEIKQHI